MPASPLTYTRCTQAKKSQLHIKHIWFFANTRANAKNQKSLILPTLKKNNRQKNEKLLNLISLHLSEKK